VARLPRSGAGPRALLLLAAATLASCTAAEPAAPPGASAYFPLAPGARWRYQLRGRLGEYQIEAVARGEVELRGGDRVFLVEETSEGGPPGFARTNPVAYVVDEGHVARLEGVGWDREGELRVLGQDAPTWLLPLDGLPGARWTQEHRIFATPEGGGALRRFNAEVRRGEPVEVEAGSFEDVLEVRTSYRDPAAGAKDVPLLFVDSYARGVGLVRSLTFEQGDPHPAVEQSLVEYRRAGTSAP
jgi:hypothetical protein